MTIPFVLFAKSMSTCVRSRAWQFSYVTSWLSLSWPMSAKWFITELRMSISISVAFTFFASVHALSCVRSVVPKQGMVTARIPFVSMPHFLKARNVTRSASVESRQPLKPMTALFAWICRSRFARPSDWSSMTALHRSARSFESSGTNGCGCTVLRSVPEVSVKFSAAAKPVWIFSESKSMYIVRISELCALCCVVALKEAQQSANVPVCILSCARRSRSISAYKMSSVNRLDSARTAPFSAMILCPAKTMSVVDSPWPASQYR